MKAGRNRKTGAAFAALAVILLVNVNNAQGQPQPGLFSRARSWAAGTRFGRVLGMRPSVLDVAARTPLPRPRARSLLQQRVTRAPFADLPPAVPAPAAVPAPETRRTILRAKRAARQEQMAAILAGPAAPEAGEEGPPFQRLRRMQRVPSGFEARLAELVGAQEQAVAGLAGEEVAARQAMRLGFFEGFPREEGISDVTAATRIQAAWRGRLGRQTARARREAAAATRIQAAWRGRLGRREAARLRQAALLEQAAGIPLPEDVPGGQIVFRPVRRLEAPVGEITEVPLLGERRLALGQIWRATPLFDQPIRIDFEETVGTMATVQPRRLMVGQTETVVSDPITEYPELMQSLQTFMDRDPEARFIRYQMERTLGSENTLVDLGFAKKDPVTRRIPRDPTTGELVLTDTGQSFKTDVETRLAQRIQAKRQELLGGQDTQDLIQARLNADNQTDPTYTRRLQLVGGEWKIVATRGEPVFRPREFGYDPQSQLFDLSKMAQIPELEGVARMVARGLSTTDLNNFASQAEAVGDTATLNLIREAQARRP